MTNRYAGQCACGARVAPGSGKCSKVGGRWIVACSDCSGRETIMATNSRGVAVPTSAVGTSRSSGYVPRGIATTFNSGHTVYRNARGKCEDAPCCGCCS